MILSSVIGSADDLLVISAMTNNTAPTVFLARQPIFDRRLKLFAYELLYRSAGGGSATQIGVKESAETLVRAIVEIGLDKLVGENTAFINIPYHLLLDPAIELLPKERVVLEILEDTPPTDEALEACQRLSKSGFRLALDDYIFGSPTSAFVPFCKIVKVDLLQNDRFLLADNVKELKKQRVRVLAEKVETMPMYHRCQAIGFDYYQGYYFARPDVVSGRGVPATKTLMLQLLNKLQDPRVTIDELERLVSAEVTLTYRLLRLVNSAAVTTGENIESVRTALMRLGLEQVVALVSLLALSGAGGGSSELMVTAMVRAKMCEEIATSLRYGNEDKHFTVGLLSMLEAIFGVPMAEIIEHIPLAPDVHEALVNPLADSNLGESLRITLAFENGRWDELGKLKTTGARISNSYLTAVKWADDARTNLAA